MSNAAVSVVIPLYNSQEWIGETIGSVQQQRADAQSLEVIVVDSGSTDESAYAAHEALSSGRVPYRILTLDRNYGPSYARNVGWRYSSAPWIQFLDSDDLLLERKIEHQLLAAHNASPEVAVIYSEWQSYRLDHSWTPSPPLVAPNLDGDVIEKLLMTEHFIATGSDLIRRCWLEQVSGYDEDRHLIEDVHLRLRIAMAGGSFLKAHAGQALFYYRRRGPASLSGRRHAEFLKGCVLNLRLAEAHWTERNLLTRQKLDFLLRSYEPLLHQLAEVDSAEFDILLQHILTLAPRWLPGQTKMGLLSRLVGYRDAEQFAIAYRRLRRRLRSKFIPS
jgi:glycosyltransferase involved in cell wall biosynthesis